MSGGDGVVWDIHPDTDQINHAAAPQPSLIA
jgi:hypothetical protein